MKNRKLKVDTEERLALAFHRNCLILLGKLPLRQIVIKFLKLLLTEGRSEFPPRKFREILGVRNACFGALELANGMVQRNRQRAKSFITNETW